MLDGKQQADLAKLWQPVGGRWIEENPLLTGNKCRHQAISKAVD
jgi:hypothetical protein